MADKFIFDIKDLKLYFNYALDSSRDSFYVRKSQREKFDYNEFYSKNYSKNSYILDEKNASKKKIMQSAKKYIEMMKILDGVNLTVYEGESTSIIGESGCGKSTLLLSILNLPQEELAYRSGEILYNNEGTIVDLLKLPEKEMLELRGFHFGYIPQMAKSAINPMIPIGFQVGELLQERLSRNQELIKSKVIEYLGKVALPDPNIKADKYVHQLSGGEAQRVVIALALINNPHIILADEMFSALDTVLQSQIMDLLKDLSEKIHLQYVIASHNISAAINITQRIAVMYGGQIVESTPVKKFLEEPLHPYTQGMLNATPWYAARKGTEFEAIPGDSPQPFVWPKGCRFASRCKKAFAKCIREAPPLIQIEETTVACWLYSE